MIFFFILIFFSFLFHKVHWSFIFFFTLSLFVFVFFFYFSFCEFECFYFIFFQIFNWLNFIFWFNHFLIYWCACVCLSSSRGFLVVTLKLICKWHKHSFECKTHFRPLIYFYTSLFFLHKWCHFCSNSIIIFVFGMVFISNMVFFFCWWKRFVWNIYKMNEVSCDVNQTSRWKKTRLFTACSM